jgi:hypothetical protein
MTFKNVVAASAGSYRLTLPLAGLSPEQAAAFEGGRSEEDHRLPRIVVKRSAVTSQGRLSPG